MKYLLNLIVLMTSIQGSAIPFNLPPQIFSTTQPILRRAYKYESLSSTLSPVDAILSKRILEKDISIVEALGNKIKFEDDIQCVIEKVIVELKRIRDKLNYCYRKGTA